MTPSMLAQDPGFHLWVARREKKKKPMPPAAFYLVEHWLKQAEMDRSHLADTGALQCTLRTIVEYVMGRPVDEHRFNVARADFGFTKIELDALVNDVGRDEAALGVARQVVARGAHPDPDEDSSEEE